jgi:hypothetical protein
MLQRPLESFYKGALNMILSSQTILLLAGTSLCTLIFFSQKYVNVYHTSDGRGGGNTMHNEKIHKFDKKIHILIKTMKILCSYERLTSRHKGIMLHATNCGPPDGRST